MCVCVSGMVWPACISRAEGAQGEGRAQRHLMHSRAEIFATDLELKSLERKRLEKDVASRAIERAGSDVIGKLKEDLRERPERRPWAGARGLNSDRSVDSGGPQEAWKRTAAGAHPTRDRRRP